MRVPRTTLAAAVLLAALLAACTGSDGGDSVGAVSVADSAGVRIVTNDLAQVSAACTLDDTPRLVVGDRPGDPNHELFRVFGGALLGDGRLAVVDQGSQSLRLYSPEGEFLTAGGRAGEGPGEFRRAFRLWRMPGDTLWVGDYGPWEFEVFSPEGEWVRGIRTEPAYPNPPQAYAVLADGRAMLGSEDPTSRDRDFSMSDVTLVLHGGDGASVGVFGVLPNTRYGTFGDDAAAMFISPWFEPRLVAGAVGNQVVLAHGREPELRFHDVTDTLELRRIVRWTGIDRTVSAADVEAATQATEAQYAAYDLSIRERIMGPLTDADRPVADAFPALINFSSGTDGSLWIKEYPKPTGPDDETWVRFDADGRFVCRLPVPAEAFDVYEFGADYLVAKVEKDMDIETVQVIGVVGPS